MKPRYRYSWIKKRYEWMVYSSISWKFETMVDYYTQCRALFRKRGK